MKRTTSLLSLSLLGLPASAAAQGLQGYLTNFVQFIDGVLIPFLFGIAFLLFVVNAIRFFVIQANNQDGRENAKSLIIYSVLGFVFLIIFWGIINLLAGSLNFDGQSQSQSDYVDLKNGGGYAPSNCTSNPRGTAC